MISKALSITFIIALGVDVVVVRGFLPHPVLEVRSRNGSRSRAKSHVLAVGGMQARVHGHYVRNYMLHMPFTHRSTLTMNINGVEGGCEERCSQNRKHKRGLSFFSPQVLTR